MCKLILNQEFYVKKKNQYNVRHSGSVDKRYITDIESRKCRSMGCYTIPSAEVKSEMLFEP